MSIATDPLVSKRWEGLPFSFDKPYMQSRYEPPCFPCENLTEMVLKTVVFARSIRLSHSADILLTYVPR